LFKHLKRKIPPRLHDLLWHRDLKARLFAWTCIGIAFIIAAFLVSERVALFLYDYSFSIVPGTSWGKVTALLAWLLCTYIIAYVAVRKKWRPFHFRRLFLVFLALVASLLLINILVFNSMLDSTGGSALGDALGVPKSRLVILSHRPEAYVSYSSSTLGHTHSLKPVIYWALNFFTDADGVHYDVGAGFYEFYPAPWLICPLVVALLMAYFGVCVMVIAHTANEKRAYFAWFNLLLFSLISFSFLAAVLEGGPLSTTAGVGVALLSLYLLLRYLRRRREVRWVLILIFLPLFTMAIFNAFSLEPWGVSLQQHFIISNLGIAAAGVYEFGRRGTKSLLLVLIIFFLAFNLSSIRFHPPIGESREGDDVYMLLYTDPSTTDNEILKRLASVSELVEPEIIARYVRNTFVRAGVAEAGVTSLDLARQVLGGRPTPLTSSIRFRFGDPSLKDSYFIYLLVDEARLRQISLDPIEVLSLRKVDSNLVEVGFLAPQGLHKHTAYQCLMLTLSERGLRPTHCIYIWPSAGRTATTRAGDFLRALIPVTRLQPVIETAFP
jgi:hypothetical protein